jgi:hypothetical protein
MRKLLFGIVSAVLVLSNTGCLIPIYSPDRTRRMSQLLVTSENLRMVTDEWERAWLLDQPQHTTPYRTHGGF